MSEVFSYNTAELYERWQAGDISDEERISYLAQPGLPTTLRTMFSKDNPGRQAPSISLHEYPPTYIEEIDKEQELENLIATSSGMVQAGYMIALNKYRASQRLLSKNK